MNDPLAIDLFCGLGGWSDGLLAEGYTVVGIDVERHDYGTGVYPGQLVLQDVLTLHGAQFRDAALIVASPPCQEFSYMAMPWKRSKKLSAALRDEASFPPGYTGSRTVQELRQLFDACFRIQREACQAAGRYIPLVVENVKGAQPWVGRAKANYGSYYLWGDMASVGGRIVRGDIRPGFGMAAIAAQKRRVSGSFQTAAVNAGRKVPGIKLSEVGFNVAAAQRWREEQGTKQTGLSCHAWFDLGAAHYSSRSDSRRAASAQIAKIPLPLAQHVARIFRPR